MTVVVGVKHSGLVVVIITLVAVAGLVGEERASAVIVGGTFTSVEASIDGATVT